MPQWIKHCLIIVLSATILAACSSAPKKESSEKELYEAAKKSIKLRNFQQATLALEELESRFPFGKYAEQAQLDLVYARYSALDLDGAILAADRFIRLHPQSPNVDYAYYLRGVANYNLDGGIATQFFTDVDITSRDPGNMRTAFQDFAQLINQYPESQYAADARKRMLMIRNRLAAYELHAARYYIRREAYTAAANRAAYVVENFPSSPVVEEALAMMVELYDETGLLKLKEDALTVLKANYPEGIAFNDDGSFKKQFIQKESRSLLSVISFGFLE
ncbi:transporter [Oleiphilus sp. HI0125]|jgi:outer membrane protein assembly factor BamD|uniref:outer membrane protein assembly factor BamD n=1 Tax=Oleiphilus sp. HI0125 TaxID=1822266 RepID=UPI0007C26594|nr:outer membrane protein assembly factor BamD [Oleiphilus sp. HI0125]KZZ58330.1 transporter [Oleiphilus sp. HI0125]KZZ58616.1 transporter [Oleiphilus sp. HI0125]